ncbi:hypothetical protein BDK51DRAFT_29320, partial [Blyttiomyces helicus]
MPGELINLNMNSTHQQLFVPVPVTIPTIDHPSIAPNRNAAEASTASQAQPRQQNAATTPATTASGSSHPHCRPPRLHSPTQNKILSDAFQDDPKPKPDFYDRHPREVSLTVTQVKEWFNRTRRKLRTKAENEQ